jgi:hypothetical protein
VDLGLQPMVTMNGRAPGFQRFVLLADARQAYESGDVSAALTQIDTLLASDPGFAAAQALRQEISASLRRRRPNWTKTLRTIGTFVLPAVAAILAIGAAAAVGWYNYPCRQCSAPQAPPRAPGADLVLPPQAPVQPASAPDVIPRATDAPAWLSARLTRLRARPQWRAAAVDVPDSALLRDLGEGIAQLWIGTIPSDVDALFVGGEAGPLTWAAWRASLKSNAVIWRIAPDNVVDDETVTSAAASAGFSRHRRIAYARGYVAEQYALNRSTP